MEKRYLNVKECANYLGFSPNTVYAWVHMRKVPFIKVGRIVKFDRIDIDRWMEKKKERPFRWD